MVLRLTGSRLLVTFTGLGQVSPRVPHAQKGITLPWQRMRKYSKLNQSIITYYLRTQIPLGVTKTTNADPNPIFNKNLALETSIIRIYNGRTNAQIYVFFKKNTMQPYAMVWPSSISDACQKKNVCGVNEKWWVEEKGVNRSTEKSNFFSLLVFLQFSSDHKHALSVSCCCHFLDASHTRHARRRWAPLRNHNVDFEAITNL